MESGVADIEITDWDKYVSDLQERLGGDNKIVKLLTNRAKTEPKTIVFAEADQLDVLKAAQIVHEEGIGLIAVSDKNKGPRLVFIIFVVAILDTPCCLSISSITGFTTFG